MADIYMIVVDDHGETSHSVFTNVDMNSVIMAVDLINDSDGYDIHPLTEEQDSLELCVRCGLPVTTGHCQPVIP